MEKMSTPPGWGTDNLTRFMDDSYRQQLATFAQMEDFFQNLIVVDSWFVRVRDGSPKLPNTVSAMLLVRSHSAYTAACESATAGRVVEAFVHNRVCLECAGYALHIDENPELGVTWLGRVTHPEAAGKEKADAANAVKKEFTIKKIKSTIKKVKKVGGRLEKDFVELYERAIEFGAHPNSPSVLGGLIASEDNTGFSLITRHGGDVAHNFALRSTALSGFCALEILQEAFRKQFKDSGVSASLRNAFARP